MRKKSARHSSAFGFALFIGSLIVLLILAAVGIKIFLLFQHSSFDGKHQFSLKIQEQGQARFVIFNPQDQSIHTVLVHGSTTSKEAQTLGIPIDATMVSNSDISSFAVLADTLLFHKKAVKASTTIIDGINLFIFIHTADSAKTISQEMLLASLPSTQNTVLSKVCTDITIYKEGESIAIVNGTGVAGLGNKIAMLLTHMGANVVSITTADQDIPTSSVTFSGGTTYTVARLSHVLALSPTHLSTAAISDITVTLGKDKANSF